MHHFSSKSSKTRHLNHENSDKRATFSDKWSPGGGGRSAPSPPTGFGPECAFNTYCHERVLFSENNNNETQETSLDTKVSVSKMDADAIKDDGLKILTPKANNDMNGLLIRGCQEFKISVGTASISEKQLFDTYGNDYVESKSTPRTFAIILDQRLLDGESSSKYFIELLLTNVYLDRGLENIASILQDHGCLPHAPRTVSRKIAQEKPNSLKCYYSRNFTVPKINRSIWTIFKSTNSKKLKVHL